MNQKGIEPMKQQRSVRFESEAAEWLEDQAKKQRRSVAEIIRMIVDYAKANGWGE